MFLSRSMFPHTVTVYNTEIKTDSDDFESKSIHHITVLRGVLLVASKAVNVLESGLESADAVTLHIPFSVKAVDGITGEETRYVPPVEYWRKTDRSGLWTLSISSRVPGVDGNTFFIKGEVVEPDKSPEMIDMEYDHVYSITKVDTFDFGSPAMQHWEVGGV